MEQVNITTEFIKLDQFLKWSGVADNGAEAKNMVLEGIIRVNGETALQRGKKLYKGDKISIEAHGEFVIV